MRRFLLRRQMIIRLHAELRHKNDELKEVRDKLHSVSNKYGVVKENFVKCDKENRRLIEEIRNFEGRMKATEGRMMGNHEEHDRVIRELSSDNKKLAEDRDALANKVRELSKMLDRVRSSPKMALVGREIDPTINVLIDASPKSPRRGDSHHYIGHSRTPSRVELLVEPDNHSIPVLIRGEKTVLRDPSRNRVMIAREKENIPQNSPGKLVPTRAKKLIASWSHVVDLIDAFEQLALDYEMVNKQINKDKTRMEGLAAKKPDLTPYLREISKILSNPAVEPLFKTKRDLETAESEQLSKAISNFEKLAEEFRHAYGAYSDKLKSKQADYVRWNSQLAAYCQRAYP